jgi:hypothetical protein
VKGFSWHPHRGIETIAYLITAEKWKYNDIVSANIPRIIDETVEVRLLSGYLGVSVRGGGRWTEETPPGASVVRVCPGGHARGRTCGLGRPPIVMNTVMNTKEELEQTFRDLDNGTFLRK